MVSCGESHVAVVTAAGAVLVFGPSAAGAEVLGRVGQLEHVIGVVCGASHTIAWSAAKVWSWGINDCGQCGHSGNDVREIDGITAPVVSASAKGKVCMCGAAEASDAADAGLFFPQMSILLLSDGTVWWFGEGVAQQPQRVQFVRPYIIAMVATGGAHCVAVTSCGRVLGWGSNMEAQLGTTGTPHNREPVVLLQSAAECSVVAAACGAKHTVLLLADGTVICMGSNSSGQLGGPHASYNALGLKQVCGVSCGDYSSCAWDAAGVVWVWGKLVGTGFKVMKYLFISRRLKTFAQEHALKPRVLSEALGRVCTLAALGSTHLVTLSAANAEASFKAFHVRELSFVESLITDPYSIDSLLRFVFHVRATADHFVGSASCAKRCALAGVVQAERPARNALV